jgi:hypothetical protein
MPRRENDFGVLPYSLPFSRLHRIKVPPPARNAGFVPAFYQRGLAAMEFRVDQHRDSFEDAAPRQPQQAQSAPSRPHAGFQRSTANIGGHEIRAQMLVISAEGTYLGTVEGIEGDEIRLGDAPDGAHRLLPLSLVAGVDGERVMMRDRGDNVFGMEA